MIIALLCALLLAAPASADELPGPGDSATEPTTPAADAEGGTLTSTVPRASERQAPPVETTRHPASTPSFWLTLAQIGSDLLDLLVLLGGSMGGSLLGYVTTKSRLRSIDPTAYKAGSVLRWFISQFSDLAILGALRGELLAAQAQAAVERDRRIASEQEVKRLRAERPASAPPHDEVAPVVAGLQAQVADIQAQLQQLLQRRGPTISPALEAELLELARRLRQ